MEKNNLNEYEYSPVEYCIINSLKKNIWKNTFKKENNNLIFDDISNYELVLEKIEDILNNLNIDYELFEVNFLWNNNLVIKLWNKEYLKVICDVSVIDIIKYKINKLLNK